MFGLEGKLIFSRILRFVRFPRNRPSLKTSIINLSSDLNKIRNWATQWKINFNPDPSKQALKVIFSRKLQKTNYNPIYFNHNSVQQAPSQKHLGMYLDTKFNF